MTHPTEDRRGHPHPDRPAVMEASRAITRLIAMRRGARRLTAFEAAVASLDAFETAMRQLEAESPRQRSGPRDLDASAVIRGIAETRLKRWRAAALDPHAQITETQP